jgi:hypothetical protein
VDGWELAFEIIGSIFVIPDAAPHDRRGPVSLTTRSSKLIRSSFNSLQLICSDFLATLPNSCFLSLVDTLYKFCSQDDELNIALTVSFSCMDRPPSFQTLLLTSSDNHLLLGFVRLSVGQRRVPENHRGAHEGYQRY